MRVCVCEELKRRRTRSKNVVVCVCVFFFFFYLLSKTIQIRGKNLHNKYIHVQLILFFHFLCKFYRETFSFFFFLFVCVEIFI